MQKTAWQRPLLSALAASISLGFMLPAHAASEWKPGIPRTAYVTMFEWNWDSVAKECTNFLGPKGYAAVQVSPPNEHGSGSEWWRDYQPVSYKIASRRGNRTQFQNMVNTCKAAGVDVYADVVVNHMADYNGGTGTGGSTWSARNFPAVPFSSSDFHSPKCDIADADYGNNRNNVMNCDMPGLPDLNTSIGSVQDKIAAYMKDLLSLGVAGFRMDAAKHISPSDLGAIKSKVPGSYFFTQEVIRDGTVGSATSGDLLGYQNLGTVNEFNYIYAMKNSFLNLYSSNLSTLPNAFSTWGFLPSSKATVFVNNHDTERKMCSGYSVGSTCDSLSTLNGVKLYLANVFMMAYDYGYPTVASGYYFSDHDGGAPGAQPYNGTETTPANCSSSYASGKWDCVHRDKRVANMVGFRNYVSGTSVGNWVSGDVNQIAFTRGNNGFVAINNSGNTWQKTFTTGLADGNYCNVVASDNPESGSCPGTSVTVTGGQATLSIAPSSAVALHIGAKVGPIVDIIAPTVPGKPTASAITSNGATLTWTASTDAVGVTGYQILRNGSQIATSTSNSYTDSNALPATSYTYSVKAYDAANNVSAASATTAVTTLPTGTTNKATVYYYRTDWSNVNVHYGVNNVWTAAPGVAMTLACTGYYSKVIDLGSATSLAATFNNESTWDNNNSANYALGTGISVVKGGVITKGANPCSGGDTVAPTVPAGLSSSNIRTTGATIRWTASTDAVGVTGYKVFRNGTQVGTSTSATYTDSGLSAATTYSYTVQAYDAAGNVSAASSALSVTTLPNTSTGVTVTFKINATTSLGESVYITGNQAVLGNWSTAQDAARKCSPTAYPVWTCTITFPAGNTAITYKYQKLGLSTKWESGADRTYTVPTAAATKDDGSFRP